MWALQHIARCVMVKVVRKTGSGCRTLQFAAPHRSHSASVPWTTDAPKSFRRSAHSDRIDRRVIRMQPAGIAIGVALVLPDRHAFLHSVDDMAACRKGGVAVR